MTIKEKFLVDTDILKLPCVVIQENPIKMWNFKSVAYLLGTADDEVFDIANLQYTAASVQRDLEGNETFVIIFAK